MSDSFQMLVDPEVSLERGAQVAAGIVRHFQEVGLIGELDASAALGGAGYRPGRRIAALYRLGAREHPFWTLSTCGMELRIRRQFNEFALGPSFERLTCPACLTSYDYLTEPLQSEIFVAIERWLAGSTQIDVRCPTCQSARPITSWEWIPPIGFGNLALVFWNWPPLDARGWRLDIGAIVAELTGHRVVRTRGIL